MLERTHRTATSDQIARLEGLTSMKSHSKLLLLYGTEVLSYLEVGYWRRQFSMGREYVEDSRKTGRPPDFNCHRRIRQALEERPIAVVRTLAKATRYAPSTVFFVLNEVLGLKFRHWRWVPTYSLMSKSERVRQSILLRTQLQRAAARS
jgi:hypothetical protein